MRLLRLVPLMAVLLLAPAAAHAQGNTAGLWSLAPDGNPRIGVLLPVDLDDLRVCPPGGVCESVNVRDLPHEPGETAVGTIFEADVFGVTERSAAWQGRVTSTRAPSMTGTLASGESLTPTAGTWSGGWGDDVSRLSLFVCRTEAGEGCVYVAGPLRTAYVGGYAFAVDARAGRSEPAGLAPPDGASQPLPASAASVALSAPAGPIAARAVDAPRIVPPTGPGGGPAPGAKPKGPKVTLRKRVLRRGARVTVGTVTCQARCKVRLSVGDGRRTLKRDLSVRGTARLAIVKGSKLRKRVRLRVTVTVDGKRLASRRLRS